MKKHYILLSIFLLPFCLFAQEDAWVYFKDKPNVEAAISNPISILTQRSIDRKTEHDIVIDARDVPVNASYITEVKNQAGIDVLAKSKWFNAVHVRGSVETISALLSLSFVESIEFANNDLNSNSRIQKMNDKFLEEGVEVDFIYGSTANQVEMISADELHQLDFTGEGILVAVLDSGFPAVNTMAAFQRARDRGKILGGYDFQRRTSDIYGYVNSSHGTWVLSTMAGYIDNQYVGTAPDASYLLFRTEVDEFENPVEESFWVEAAERSDSLGVDLINTSLGYKQYDKPSYSYTDAELDGKTAFITRGATIASEKGMLIVTSAGNSGTAGVGAPADSEAVFSIGAVDANENYVSFSSRGNTFQPSIKPDVVARGGAAVVVNTDGRIVNLNGTSFSSPIMAGGMACLMQALPNASVEELKSLVRQSASQSNSPDFLLGYGIPDLLLAYEQVEEVESTAFEVLNIFPNPVSTKLYIQIPDEDLNTNYQVFDVLGKLVLESTLTQPQTELDTTFLAQGIYLLRLNGSINKTIKLIKS